MSDKSFISRLVASKIMIKRKIVIVLILAAVLTAATSFPRITHYAEDQYDRCLGEYTTDMGWPLYFYHEEVINCQAPLFEAYPVFFIPVNYLFYIVMILGTYSLWRYFWYFIKRNVGPSRLE